MNRIDLHAHTNRSDGSLEPAALVALAKETGLRALAVTDHDTTSALAIAREVGRSLGVEILTGAEITARFPGRSMHVLAYGFDDRDPALCAMLAEIVAGRETRNPRIVDRLCELGAPVTMAEVRAEAKGDVIGRPHIAAALVRRGHVSDTKTAFSLFLRDGGPAYVAADRVDPEEVISTVRDAGGVTVLAHPKQLRVDTPAGYEALFGRLAMAGLSGIEVDHPSHRTDDRAFFGRLADAIGLVRTGGSDFHGASKPDVRLGSGDGSISVDYAVWEALRARCAASPA
jgi:predicted metal-dependent phosphoesterase TrpH